MYTESSDATTALPDFLLTSSKDTLLKLWDLSTQHCIETHVAHKSEIWAMVLFTQETLIGEQVVKEVRVATGGGEGENLIKIWKVDTALLKTNLNNMDVDEGTEEDTVSFSGYVCNTSIQHLYSPKELFRTMALYPDKIRTVW
jgi:U3 small nucleolar RNA-associated protein 12